MAYSLLPSSFEDIKSYLITKITESYPSLGAFLSASFLIVFIDAVAWGLALFMDYADNLYSESHLESATVYENARLIAKFYGYEAHREISAQGEIRIGMTADYDTLPTESITFNKYDSLTINGISFLIAESITFSSNPLDSSYDDLPANTYYIDVPVIQGQLITAISAAAGTQSETITITNSSIENTVFDVYVNGTLYTKVNSFFESISTDTHYTLENTSNMLGVILTFGDGYRGKQLTAGDEIELNYINTDALEGQIKSVGFDVIFNEAYTYSDMSPVTFYGITISQMIGADIIENIESIKYWGRKTASLMSEKAFTDDDVQLTLQEFGGILKSKAVSEYDLSPDSPDAQYMNFIRLLVVPTSGTVIDAVTQQRIREYLYPKMDFTDFIQFIDVEYIDIFFKINAEVFSNAPQDLSTQIGTFLETTYALGTLDFGASVDHSTVVYNINKEFIDYLKRFTLELWVSEEYESPSLGTGRSLDKTLRLGSLRAGEVNIIICTLVIDFMIGAVEYTESITDNGAGIFSPSGSAVIDSGSINYETGVVALIIDSAVTSITNLDLQYRVYDLDAQDENIDIKYNQIARYSKATVSVEVV